MSITSKHIDALIIGGGPAGLAAAVKLYRQGVHDILIVEREKKLGGILRQCIHDGFGLSRFGESISGPEYADRFIAEVRQLGIPYLTDASVIALSPEKEVTVASAAGLLHYSASAVILAMGCRERTRGALAIPGERPAGVYTAGVAQAYMNLYDRMPAKEAVILGSGDIGLIMARRLTLEGATVKGVYELQSYPSGLPRNIEQCLNDYHIPLYLDHTVTEIHGDRRLCAVTVAALDKQKRVIPGTEQRIPCDTLILSVGLIPENELSIDAGVQLNPHTKGAVVDEYLQTSVPGIFAAGNVLHVHDLVDFVSAEAEHLAESVAKYLEHGALPACPVPIRCGKGIQHTIPQSIRGTDPVRLSLRVNAPFENAVLTVAQGEQTLYQRRFRKLLPAVMQEISLPSALSDPALPLEVSVQ